MTPRRRLSSPRRRKSYSRSFLSYYCTGRSTSCHSARRWPGRATPDHRKARRGCWNRSSRPPGEQPYTGRQGSGEFRQGRTAALGGGRLDCAKTKQTGCGHFLSMSSFLPTGNIVSALTRTACLTSFTQLFASGFMGLIDLPSQPCPDSCHSIVSSCALTLWKLLTVHQVK